MVFYTVSKIYNGPTGKVKDIQGIQAHAGRNYFVPEGKEFSFDIDQCPYLHIAIKAEPGTSTCLFLLVHEREHDWNRRFVVIGKTQKGEYRHHLMSNYFTIEDDNEWYEYVYDLRKIREEEDDNIYHQPLCPDAGSIREIQFYAWTGSGTHTFHFNDLVSNTVAGAEIDEHRVEGHIFFEYGLPAGGIPVRLYSRGFGGVKTLLNKGKTDDQGFYDVSYYPRGKSTNLEVCIEDPQGEEIPLSDTKFKVEKHEVLNLVAPERVRPLAAEYQRLTADLEKQLVSMEELAGAQEKGERRDLSLLHQDTGWDARLIALSATAARMSADTCIRQDALYALFRAGLPTEKQTLASVSSSAVEKVLKKTKEAGIVDPEFSVEKAKKAFENFSLHTLREMKAPGTLSRFDELLNKSGLSNDDKSKFEEIYFAHRGAPTELWQKAHNKGISAEKIKCLRLQGKLAYLTLNNAKLTETLQKEIGSLDNLAQLVGKDEEEKKEKGYYKEDAWKKLLKEDIAKNNEQVLQELIPPAYVGETADDRLDAYAADLARKVRLSYPTAVVGRMIEKDELPLGAGHDKTAVITFLKNAQELGFELGQVPVDAFVQKNKKKLFPPNTTPEKIEAVGQSVKMLQRLYQITPSDEEYRALFKLGFTSAHDVVAFTKDDFLDRFADSFLSRERAELVYCKSQQVSTVTYTFFTTAKLMESAPAVHVISSPAEVRENAKNELIKHYPTMKSLFGSLDFCECEHCRSVLSPAAYFVDLLQFLDPDDLVWKRTLNDWKNEHNGERYKKDWNYDHIGEAYEDERKKPYYALIERRPDLPHLPLTCENTHTALPYIDVANEILEYYVAYNNLNNYQGHDTGDATTPELLAEPQNILSEAYNELKKAYYPLALPFDLWLETVRRFFDHFETPLWQVMEVFRLTDELFDLPLPPKPAIENPTNITNATVEVPDADAVMFKVGDVVTYYDVDADALHTETKTISSVGTAGSGGAGKTLITLSGVWTTPPVADDLLVKTDRNYNRANIFAEYLGISPAEYDVFTNSSLHSTWYELYGYTTKDKACTEAVDEQGKRIDLNSAKALSRRLGVNYKELVDLVCTGFINPKLDALVVLRKLGLEVKDVFRYKKHSMYQQFTADEKAAFEKRFDDLTKKFNPDLDPSPFNARNWLETTWQNGDFNQILVLADPNAGCNFDETTLQYADGDPADELVYLKINLFVCLWKKLGWTIEETDQALRVFLPKNSLPLTTQNLGTALKTSLVYIAHLKALDERVKIGKNSRLKLLTIWSNLSTTGKNPLYAQLFLTRSMLKNDPVFDDPLGNYLPKADVLIKDHLLALQAALNLTSSEIEQILRDVQKNLDSAPLTLETASLLYRYGLLAKGLKLPVIDLITLKGLLGLDPFEPLKSSPLATLTDDDHPFTKTLRFTEVVEKVKESGFTVEDLNFLLYHRFDPVGKYRSKSDVILALMKTLAAEIRRIHAEHAIPDATNATTDDFLRQKLALVLSADVLNMFFGFWKDTVEFSAKREQVEEEQKLDPTTYQVDAIRVSYDDTRKWQHVVHVGVLTNDKKNKILSKISQPDASAPQEQKDAYNNFIELLNKIAAESQPQPKAFFDKYFEGFLTYDDLYGSFATGLSEEANRHKILAAILPFVQQKLTRQFIVQTIATNLNADPVLTEVLLTARRLPPSPNQLGEPLVADPTQSGKLLLDAFATSGERGVSATFFDSSGAQLGQTRTTETADTAIKVNNTPIKPAGAKSARFEGYIEVPATGAYRFFAVFTTQDTTAELRFAHLPDPVIHHKDTKNNDETDQFVELKAGIPYRFTFEIGDLMGGDVSLLVQGENLPKDTLSRLTLYPQAVVERFNRTHVLTAKTLQLIQGLGLSEREVRHILTHRADFDNIDLSRVPTLENDSLAESPVTLFKQFLLLADHAHLKRDLSAGTDDLIGIFENAHRTYPEITDAEEAKTVHLEPIAHLTRRDSTTVRAVAESLGFAINATPDGNGYRIDVQDIANVENLWRLWEALQVVEKLGVPVNKIVSWATPAFLDFSIARDLRNTVNARYEPENWQRIAQSIFDKLRQRKRDTLVAYIMHNEGFERIEQLFEYFLIDPGMEPVVQTSRLRLAISSVQLFIQRSLLNLEKNVHPSAIINSKHWQWIKRYRVWEANRKIFLFPENWLEPEFRDDKTHLFQELESTLLQGDVSNDLAEEAFFNYLKKLEELARLDIVTMYCEEKSDPASNTLHVIGRTYSLPHKYFYRRYAHQMWTPWELVTAEIEGDHVVAVVWRERLHLFWLTFLEKAKQKTITNKKGKELTLSQMADKKVSEIASSKTVEVQLNWSVYFQGEWTTREAGGFTNPISVDVSNNFKSSDVFIFASQSEDGSLLVNLHSPINSAFRMVSKNSPPEPVGCVAHQNPPYSIIGNQPTRYSGSGALTYTFVERLETEYIIQGIREDSKFSLLFCPSPPTSIDTDVLIKKVDFLIGKVRVLLQPICDHVGDESDVLDTLHLFVNYLRALVLSSHFTSRVTAEWKSIKDSIQKVKDDVQDYDIYDIEAYEKARKFMQVINSIEELINSIDVLLRQIIDVAGATAVADPVSAEIRKLVNPFFYQDEQHTFFVEPTLTETTITDWEEWAISMLRHRAVCEDLEYMRELPVKNCVPLTEPPFPEPIDPFAHFMINPKIEWVTDPMTVLRFDDRFIGQEGGLDLKVLPAGTRVSDFGTLVNVTPDSELISGSVVVAYDERKLGAGRFPLPKGGLNVVGGGGMNSALLRSLSRKHGGV
jgi:hypothetical protein